MTEQGKRMERLLYEHPDEILDVILRDTDVLFDLEDILVMAQIYHGVSPRQCEDSTVFLVDNIIRLQNHCRLLFLEFNDKRPGAYFDFAELFIFLLNKNVPMNQLLTFSLEEFQHKVVDYQEIFEC